MRASICYHFIHETYVENTNLGWSFYSWVEELEVLDFV